MAGKADQPPLADPPTIRPETQALDALIRATMARAQKNRSGQPVDTMLFLGNTHHAYPVLLVQDPVLEPVDKIVWLVIQQSAQAGGGPTAFPSYAELATKANIASTSTIARVIAILRATRWLSLCARVRDPGGRFRGNVYALHDEPLPLVDTLHLDPDYLAFLDQARDHGHARVRAVVQGVLSTIRADLQAGIDVCQRPFPQERRVEARHAVMGKPDRRYFSFNGEALQSLRAASSTSAHQDQNSKPVPDRLRNSHPQKSKSVSSSDIYKTTTTLDRQRKNAKGKFTPSPDLIFPDQLSAGHYDLAMSCLSTVPNEHHQSILDELAGRMLAVAHGMSPLYDEMSFLRSLCNHARNGTFVKKLGLKVTEQRQRTQVTGATTRSPARADPPAADERSWEQRKARAVAGIAQIRDILSDTPPNDESRKKAIP